MQFKVNWKCFTALARAEISQTNKQQLKANRMVKWTALEWDLREALMCWRHSTLHVFNAMYAQYCMPSNQAFGHHEVSKQRIVYYQTPENPFDLF